MQNGNVSAPHHSIDRSPIILLLIIAGFISLIVYLSWFFQDGRLGHPLVLLGFLGMVSYAFFQYVTNWIIYLALSYRESSLVGDTADLDVDILLTVYKEEPEFIETTIKAVTNIRGRYIVWVLDDGNDPQVKQLAKAYGVNYLAREGSKDAKAGNLNAALPYLKGDIIVLFDIDHIPRAEFLEEALPYFADEQIGFVQTMPTFYNKILGWVPGAATETSLDFYNPTSMGMDRFLSATKMGTNSLIRRKALVGIGGYKPGLAEDLATSIALHAAGWRSRYINKPLAPGLAPPDLNAWYTQQFKWSRGVFEVMLTKYLTLFPKLSWGQRLAYAIRGTNYWIGPFIGGHLLAVLYALYSQDQGVAAAVQSYFIYLTPFMLMVSLIRGLMSRKWKHASHEQESWYRAVLLVFNTWPAYTLAWVLAVLRVPPSFKPTPKHSARRVTLFWVLPQLLIAFALLSGIVFLYQSVPNSFELIYLYLVAIGFAILQLGLGRSLLRPWLLEKEGFARDMAEVAANEYNSSLVHSPNNHFPKKSLLSENDPCTGNS